MEKKLYWLIESNGDLSIISADPEEINNLMVSDFESLDKSEQQDVEYTITPVWYTEQEYNALQEAD